ncbi:MAG: alpha/beta fold hydrolase [Ramlibacter sp.]
MRKAHALLFAALLLPSMAALAALREEQMDVPVAVHDSFGKLIQRTIKVTVFSDDTNPKPAPVLVLNHGRAGEPQERVDLGRARYLETSQFLVQRGFIVVVPTRIGYGVTGGEDVEDSDACDRKNYPPGFQAAAQQILAALEAVRKRPDAAKNRAVVMGQSYGGAAAVAVAALNPPGVVAGINFAGGGGGNPKGRAQRPCSPHRLERMFRDYGSTARVPMLWIYTENDMYFGPKYPRDWHEAYVKAGGVAEFLQLPPYGDDGHRLFTDFPNVWKPKVIAFLEAQGFKAPAAQGAR